MMTKDEKIGLGTDLVVTGLLIGRLAGSAASLRRGWNKTMPGLFGLRPISFRQAAGLLQLVALVAAYARGVNSRKLRKLVARQMRSAMAAAPEEEPDDND